VKQTTSIDKAFNKFVGNKATENKTKSKAKVKTKKVIQTGRV
jgi:hypothetical protein